MVVAATSTKNIKLTNMSAENITLFFEKAKGSAELQEKIDALADLEPEPQMEALSQLSAQEGTPFTVDEFVSHVQEMDEMSELNDEELEGVAGGHGNKNIAMGVLRFIGNDV